MKQNLQRIDDLKIKLKRQELIKLNEINKKQEIIANLKVIRNQSDFKIALGFFNFFF